MLGRPKIDKLIDSSVKRIEEEHGPEAVIRSAIMVYDVQSEEGATCVYSFATDRREYVQRALLGEASEALLWTEAVEEVEDDD